MSSQHDFFVTRAAQSRDEAEAAVLDNVRERCLRAAAAWDGMAARAERTDKARAKTASEKALLRESEADGAAEL
jgi:hypothetical protein